MHPVWYIQNNIYTEIWKYKRSRTKYEHTVFRYLKKPRKHSIVLVDNSSDVVRRIIRLTLLDLSLILNLWTFKDSTQSVTSEWLLHIPASPTLTMLRKTRFKFVPDKNFSSEFFIHKKYDCLIFGNALNCYRFFN